MRMKKEMKMMMKKKKSSGSTKEPSRTSPFVLGPSGQNYDFSSGPLTVYRRYARRPPLDPIIVCTVAQNYSVFFTRNAKADESQHFYSWFRILRITIWFEGAWR